MALLEALLKSDCQIRIIYNVYYKSECLNKTSSPLDYSHFAFHKLAEFVDLCLRYRSNIDCILFTSTSAIYGNNSNAREFDKPDIINLYSSLKLASEFFLKTHLKETHIRLLVARVFNMYGGNDSFSVVGKIARSIKSGSELLITNQGSAVRDFIHIYDVVEIYSRLLHSKFEGLINVGTGIGTSISSVILAAEQIFRGNLNVRHITQNEIDYSVANTDYMLQKIGIIHFRSIERHYLAGRSSSNTPD